MMKKSFKNRSAVSPVIATILMVAITVVLAAVLYVMVMGFGGTSSSAPSGSIAANEKLSTADLKFTFGAFSKETQFTDCKVLLGLDNALSGSATEITTAALTSGLALTITGGEDYTVTFFDLGGDGKISSGDYCLVTADDATLAAGEYTLTLIWGQDGSTIDSSSITV